MSIFDSFQDRCDSDGLDDSALPFDDDVRGEPRVPKYGIRLRRIAKMRSASDWFMNTVSQDTPDDADLDDDKRC